MVGVTVAHPAATTKPDVAGARNRTGWGDCPRCDNIHDVGRTITHERIVCRTVLRGSWQAAEYWQSYHDGGRAETKALS